MKLDAKGRCCGRKPLDYKGGSRSVNGPEPMMFCHRCNRAFDRVTGEQIANWAYKQCPGCALWIPSGLNACGECSCEDDCAPD